MSAAASTVWVEGIGNEVIMTVILSIATLMLILAWYSTHLTPNQTRMTRMRIQRHGVSLNRLPGSSSSDNLVSSSNRYIRPIIIYLEKAVVCLLACLL